MGRCWSILIIASRVNYFDFAQVHTYWLDPDGDPITNVEYLALLALEWLEQ